MSRAPLLANEHEHTAVSVRGRSGQVLAENKARVSALFINDSGSVIYMKFGEDAVFGEGIRINGDGGSYELTIQSGTMIVDAVNAICTEGGTNKLLILERSNVK